MEALRAQLRLLRAVSLSHFGIDLFNSMGPVLLAYLSVPLALSGAQIGLAVGVYQFLAGSTQPIFGWFADRWGRRWLGAAGIVWVYGFVCAALFAADRFGSFTAFLSLFALAALGSGAFHPHGTMLSSQAVPRREATTTAVFFFCGSLGLGLGPMAAGVALDALGVEGIYLLAVCLVPIPIYLFMVLSPDLRRRQESQAGADVRGRWGAAAVLIGLIFTVRGWMYIGTAAFLPVLFQAKGWSASRQGVLVGLFSFGAGIGGVLCGVVADRFGRRLAVTAASAFAAAFLFLLPIVDGTTAFLVALAAGTLVGAPHSVMMVMSQAVLPVRRGLSSGLTLGYFFAIGAAASWVIGWFSDRYELATVLQWGALLAGVHALLALGLPASRTPGSGQPGGS